MYKLILALCVLLLGPSIALPAINCTGTSYPFNVPTDPQAQSHTFPTLTNGIAFVHAAVRSGARSVQGTPTIGGVSTTRVNARTASTDNVTEVFRLVNPPTGSQSVSVDWDATPLSYVLTIVTCDNVNQTSPIFNDNANSGTSGTTITVDCNSGSGQVVLDFASADNGGNGLTPGTGQTMLDQDTADAALSAGSSIEAGASTVTMSHTTVNSDWATICVALTPSASFGPLRRGRM